MGRRRATVAVATALVLGAAGLPAVLTPAQAAPVGQGFTVTPSDLAYILKQIKIAEAHVANTTPATGPCGALLGTGPNQIPNPLLSYGLRTVDGSCNNLQPNRAHFGASGQVFPRHATESFRPAEDGAPAGQAGQTSYATKNTNVVDSQPRLISNLIVDQTAANPAAVAAATAPIRTQGSTGVFPCETPGVPAGCIPEGQTLDIPNVTTDVGLSPPFNAWFTLFGQFFDHGLDFTKKSHGAVIVPLRSDDPLLDGLDGIPGNADDPGPNERFMVLTRTENQPGPDGVLGTADDVKEGTNTDSPFVDQSQTYASHPSHQVFLRAYADNVEGKPVSTGKLLSTADGGLSPWSLVKSAAAADLGLRLVDRDVLDIPMLATDPYGRFLPGSNGLPQWVTAGPDGTPLTADDVLVEGDRTSPVPAPADVNRIGTAFLDDIAHSAVPRQATPDQGPGRPARPALLPDGDSSITPAGGTQPAGTYDDEMLDAHFLAGDGRTNENIGLTAIHQVFHSEHDRLVDDIKNTLTTDTTAKGVVALPEWQSALGADGWNGERLFQAARFVTEMEYQHLAFEEFARKVQPAISPFAAYHDNINSAIRAEFAHAVYRFGHSMLTDTISRTNEDGTSNDVSLFDGFLNPPAFFDGGSAGRLTAPQAVGAIAMGMADQVGNEIDEFVTNTLRNNVLGLPLDLATINIARARDAGVPTLNAFRRELHAQTRDSQLTPYGSWLEFGLQLKHPQSLVNFIAAYGAHPSVLAADTIDGKREAAQLLVDPPLSTDPALVPPDAEAFITASGAWANAANGVSTSGVDDIDLWVGGLAERTNLFGGLLGSTFNVVFESQMLDLQNGDRFYYLARTPGMALLSSLEGNSFAEMVMRNSTAHTLKDDSFGTADCKFQLSRLDGTAEAFQTQGVTVADDPASECDERKLLVRRPDGTIQYRTSNTVDPSGINGQGVYNGTAGRDRVHGGVDNDTILGNEGNDVLEGGDGSDVAIGGEGDDIITDAAGDDVPKGGPGHDAIEAGPGLDIILGGTGKDFTNGGANDNETFGGDGDDMIIAGTGNDHVFGDSGSDWIQGGDGVELLCGDSCAPFFDDPNQPGDDILIGQNGDEDYDAEGGNDIMAAGPGIERNAGAAGYDWATYQYDPLPADADLSLNLVGVPLPAVVFRDRYAEVEALSGSALDDVLRGDDRVPTDVGGAGFSGCNALDAAGVSRIDGLAEIVPALTTPRADVADASGTGNCAELTGDVWGAGNLLLGGAGSDLLEGRGADDVLDGDRELRVRLSVRTNEADPASEIGSATLMEGTYQPGNPRTLQQDVFAGLVNPGNIVAVREIRSTPGPDDVDTALFSGPRADYDVAAVDGVLTVAHARGTGLDGTDTLRNVERLQFADVTLEVAAPLAPSIGTATAGDASATVTFTPTAGGPAVQGFLVQPVDPATGTSVGTASPAPAGATSLVVTGLVNGVDVAFRVAGTNDFGTGAFSAVSNTVQPAGQAPPPPADGPTVTPLTPLDGAVDVALDANVRGVFSEPVAGLSTGRRSTNVVLVDAAGTRVDARVNYAIAARRVTINPIGDLQPGTTYTATVTGDADPGLRSAATGVPVVTTSWSFTTAAGPAANPAPTILSSSPAPDATGVFLGANVLVNFSEQVVGVDGTSVQLLRAADGSVVPAAVAYRRFNRRAVLNPDARLDRRTVYRVVVTGGPGAIRDGAGNPLASTSWTFTTR